MELIHQTLLLVLLLISPSVNHVAFAGEIGIDYGLLGDNLPSPPLAVSLLQRCGIKHVRIYDPNPQVLAALHAATGSGAAFSVVVGVRNEDLQSISGDPNAAANWIATNAVPYSSIPVRGIIAGNELVPGPLSSFVVPAMRNLRAALDAVGLQSVFASTAVHSAALSNTFPPSQSVFSSDAISTMTDLVDFQNSLPPERRGPLYVHVYPYFAYANIADNIPLDYAMFRSTAVVVQDGNLSYYNLFDAMYDSFAWAVEKIGGAGIKLEVGETGWPSAGNGDLTTPYLAKTYIGNLYGLVMTGKGTPKTGNGGGPEVVMLFALFNENQKAEGVERNWGLFNPDMASVYSNPMCASEQ